jgi:outer membrane usher protein
VWSAAVVSLALLAVPQSPPPQRAILGLVVNQIEKGDILVVLRGDEVLAAVDALERAGLRGLAGKRETIGGAVMVELRSLAPDITFVVDDAALVLRITSTPALLGTTTIVGVESNRPQNIEYRRDPSLFVNYGITGRSGGADLATEFGLSAGGALVSTTISRTAEGRTRRGLTNVIVDQPHTLRRWTAGDVVANTGQLGGTAILGGIDVRREYSVDPYFIRYPTIGLSGAAATPSELDIYVNDRLVRRQQIPPGRFEVPHLPVPVGTGSAKMILRDAFGREQQVVSPYYLTTTVLAPGLQEYAYTAGIERGDSETLGFNYGRAMLAARHRFGLSESVTAGFRVEATSALISGGPSMNGKLGRLGEVELGAAASRSGDAHGVAMTAGYTYLARRISGGISDLLLRIRASRGSKRADS